MCEWNEFRVLRDNQGKKLAYIDALYGPLYNILPGFDEIEKITKKLPGCGIRVGRWVGYPQ
jgi:hypothetical protein